MPTALGSQIYPSDDVARSLGLLAAMGATYVRASATLLSVE